MIRPKILSIDPGNTTTGWCVSEYQCTSPKMVILATGSLYPSKFAHKKENKVIADKYSPAAVALDYLHEQLTEIMDTFRPQVVASEDCFINMRMPTAIKSLTLVIHTIEEVCRLKFGMPVFKYPPMVVKKVFSAKGSADKNKMKDALLLSKDIDISKVDINTMTEHEIDAIAVGYTAISHWDDVFNIDYCNHY